MLAEDLARPRTLEDAYAQCRRVALGHEENFSVVSWLLPRDRRPHLYAIYAYARGVDDIGDEAEGDRLALLDEWRAELQRCYKGRPHDPRFVALAETIRRFDIPPEPFERLIEANRRDQRIHRYDTFAGLLDYCTYSANPVGHLVLYVFGYRDAERQLMSDATCTALQLTNFWQDVSRDYAKGRVYIPREDMETFSYTEADLADRHAPRAFREMIRFEVERTREYFARGLPLIDRVSGRLKLDLRLFTLGGLAVLDAIERQGFDVLRQRPRVSKARKAWLALRGLAPVHVKAAA